jgi:uncharacterized protein YkwD
MGLPRFLAVLAFLALTACAGVPEPQGPPPPTAQQLAEVEAKIYAYIGEERARLNRDARILILDPELVSAAKVHSTVMAQRRAFDTGGADQNAAILHLMASPAFQGFVGENSAMQYFTPEAGFDPEEIARTFVRLWLDSADHRDHIQSAAFARTGIGVAVSGNEVYAAQVFSGDPVAPVRAEGGQ